MAAQAWVDGISTHEVDALVRTLDNESGMNRVGISLRVALPSIKPDTIHLRPGQPALRSGMRQIVTFF